LRDSQDTHVARLPATYLVLTQTGGFLVQLAAFCPVRMEAELEKIHPVAEQDPKWRGRSLALHVGVRKVHATTDILADGEPDRIDPGTRRPLIFSFQQFHGLAPGEVHQSERAKIPEAAYGP